jgi:hypothetical protein
MFPHIIQCSVSSSSLLEINLKSKVTVNGYAFPLKIRTMMCCINHPKLYGINRKVKMFIPYLHRILSFSLKVSASFNHHAIFQPERFLS